LNKNVFIRNNYLFVYKKILVFCKLYFYYNLFLYMLKIFNWTSLVCYINKFMFIYLNITLDKYYWTFNIVKHSQISSDWNSFWSNTTSVRLISEQIWSDVMYFGLLPSIDRWLYCYATAPPRPVSAVSFGLRSGWL